MEKRNNIIVLWEFIVKEEYLDQFIRSYSSTGEWSILFKNYKGYIKTELIKDTSAINRFVTIDYWTSYSLYSAMKKQGMQEYTSLDDRCRNFTIDENYIGIFTTI